MRTSWVQWSYLSSSHIFVCIFQRGVALDHYLRCDTLWSFNTSVVGLPLKGLNRSPAPRISFVAVSYHAMKARNDEVSASDEVEVEMRWALDLIEHF